MPRRIQRHRSVKALVIEAFFVVVFLTIGGHLGVSFWERFFIQSELTHVKASLHALKETLSNIGYAYDNLYTELRLVLDTNNNKSAIPRTLPIPTSASELEHKLRNIHTLNTLLLDDVTIHHVKNVKRDKGTLKKYYIENVATQSRVKKDAATITRRPLTATAVEADLSHENCRHHKHYQANSDIDQILFVDNLKV